jgi:protoheme IX farnesyltransferase
VALSGAFLVATNSTGGCSSWPLCGSGFSIPTTQSATITIVHRVIAGVVVIMLGGLMAMIMRRRRGDRAVRIGVMAVNLLLVLQVAAGALDAIFNLPAGLSALHIALASLLWGAVVAVGLLSLQVIGEVSPVPATPPGDAVLPRATVPQS